MVSGIVIAAIGLALGAAGLWLVVLGGSWYYLIAALAMVVTGALLIRHSAMALWIFAALLLATLLWALWEVGLDWWPLAARLGFLFLLGGFLLCPWILRSLGTREAAADVIAGPGGRASWRRGGGLALSLALVLCALPLLISLTRDVHQIEGA